MHTLKWIGKDKAVNHHLEMPYKVSEEQYTYNAETSENMIIQGDNLAVFKTFMPRFEGKVKCIYIYLKRYNKKEKKHEESSNRSNQEGIETDNKRTFFYIQVYI